MELAVSVPIATLLQGPTLASLTEQLAQLVGEPTPPATRHLPVGDGNVVLDDSIACRVTDLAREAKLDPTIEIGRSSVSGPQAVGHLLLTGVTGALGAFLLRDLLNETEAQLYCLVRASDPEHGLARLLAAWERTFPGRPLAMARIVAVPGDLAQPNLGLTVPDFERLAGQIDAIVHSGAEVNWLAPYAQLKPANVIGVETIIRLAARRQCPLHYVSTLAVFPVVGRASSEIIDEATPLEHEGLLFGGYTQKQVGGGAAS
ncbi:MAG: SDR family oxidoreductase [Anaerolineales bacterium]|nr:SDR family oxidoreductase [Anaerolineales bacterium]